jgi:hypothetical protein
LEAESRYKKEGFGNIGNYLVHKHGEEIGDIIEGYAFGMNWECKECVALDDYQYFATVEQKANRAGRRPQETVPRRPCCGRQIS